MHEADDPNAVVNILYAEPLACQAGDVSMKCVSRRCRSSPVLRPLASTRRPRRGLWAIAVPAGRHGLGVGLAEQVDQRR